MTKTLPPMDPAYIALRRLEQTVTNLRCLPADSDALAAARLAIADIESGANRNLRDAARYRWLRDGNAYRPEELSVTGGDDLDSLCDDGLAGGNGSGTAPT